MVVSAAVAPAATSGQEAAPRTPWGHPDLQGEFAGRELLTAEEMANLQQKAVDRNAELLMRPARRTEVTENLDVGEDGAPGYYNNFWLDEGTTSTGRTSIIVDPPDGRLPPLTPEARQDEEARLAARNARGPADTWTDPGSERPLHALVGGTADAAGRLQQLHTSSCRRLTTLRSMSR